MKVTLQYYDKKPDAAKAKVAKLLEGAGLVIDNAGDDMQTIEVPDAMHAKSVIARLATVANIQAQTAA